MVLDDPVSGQSSLPFPILILGSLQKGKEKAPDYPGKMKATEDWTVEDVTSWLEKKGINQEARKLFTGASYSYSRISR